MDETTAQPLPNTPRTRLALIALATLGLMLSGVLLWYSGSALPGCAPGSGCDTVLTSKWSRWLWLPVSLPAAVMYLVALLAALKLDATQSEATRRRAWWVLLVCAAAIAGSAVWFLVVQAAFVQAFCKYCLAAHAVGLTLAAITWWSARPLRKRLRVNAAILGMVSLPVLILGQLVTPPPPTHRTDAIPYHDNNARDERVLTFGLGEVHAQVPTRSHPILGSPDAPIVAVSLFDYTCPHCRTQHEHLEQAREHFGERLAIIAFPVPLNPKCNRFVEHLEPRHVPACDLAALALVVWLHAPEHFEAVHNYFMAGDLPPLLDDAVAFAQPFLPAPVAELDTTAASKKLHNYAKFYDLTRRATGRDSLPKLLVGAIRVEGRPDTAEELIEAIEEGAGGASE